MITADVRDFRGIHKARIVLDPIALIAGRNGAGKSSIAGGVAAAATGRPGTTKKDANLLVRDGAEYAVAALERDEPDGSARMGWPRAEFETLGEPPRASAAAAGLESLAAMGGQDRAAAIGKLLRTEPTLADLTAALAEAGIEDDGLRSRVWLAKEAQGWDGAHAEYRTQGARLKGQWQEVTHEQYGSSKAPGWQPKGWTPDLAAASDGDLCFDLAQKQQEVEKLVGRQAVDLTQHASLKRIADESVTRKATAADARRKLDAAEAAYTAAVARREALPAADTMSGMECPECKTPLHVVQKGKIAVLERLARMDSATLKDRRMAIAGADGEVSKAQADRIPAIRAEQDARFALDEAAKAKDQLGAIAEAPAHDEQALAAARTMAEGAAVRLAAFRAKCRADELAAQIARHQILVDTLAPDGLRLKKLTRALGIFNDDLQPLCAIAEWKRVTIADDLTIWYGQRPYALASRSERFRVRVILQLAIAGLDGSDLVIVDDAEILDAPGRNGLFSLLLFAQRPALVCMTLSKPELCPDLATANAGASFWVEDGHAMALPLDERKDAA